MLMCIYIEITMAGQQGSGYGTELKSYQDAYRVAAFCQGNPPIFDGEPPSSKAESWIYEMKAVLEASKFEPECWVPLAAIQLRGVAAIWWGKTKLNPWLAAWAEFMDLFLTRFAPEEYIPESPDSVNNVTMQYAEMDEIIRNWKPIPNEDADKYIGRFEQEVLQKSPYEMTNGEKCRLLWLGVPTHLRAYACYLTNNYYWLRSEIVRAEVEWKIQRDRHLWQAAAREMEEDPEEDPEEDLIETSKI